MIGIVECQLRIEALFSIFLDFTTHKNCDFWDGFLVGFTTLGDILGSFPTSKATRASALQAPEAG
jgi:hypothetical protein